MEHIDVITDLHGAKNGDLTANGRAHGKKPLRPPDQFPPPPPDMSRDMWSSNNSLARDSRGSADMRWDLAGRAEGKARDRKAGGYWPTTALVLSVQNNSKRGDLVPGLPNAEGFARLVWGHRDLLCLRQADSVCVSVSVNPSTALRLNSQTSLVPFAV
ncbi:hypothetical protein RRG08_041048 [Elysia crispata]|uniref:Uncharacterized protein n=1 Tax=Elysia crispata TaxID=231223 RepID=A0AAE0Y835_9GAST|nr:hypothetical protein RRG08_041048 [Elysia crispata]